MWIRRSWHTAQYCKSSPGISLFWLRDFGALVKRTAWLGSGRFRYEIGRRGRPADDHAIERAAGAASGRLVSQFSPCGVIS